MAKTRTRTVFVGTFSHSVDDKRRVAIPARWRAAAKGAKEFYILPDPKNCLVVLPAEVMEKMLDRADDISMGEYERRDALRVLSSRAHATPVDGQGRISLTESLMKHAGVEGEATLIGVLNKFEIWSPARWAEHDRNAMANFVEATKQLGL